MCWDFVQIFYPLKITNWCLQIILLLLRVSRENTLHWHFQYVKSFEYISPLFKKKNTALKPFMFCENSGKILF